MENSNPVTRLQRLPAATRVLRSRPHCNRTAVGARVRVLTGKHAQMDEVHTGGSVMSQSDLRLHFGVGQTKTIDLIEVKWPTTWKAEKFANVEVNQILTIKEGAGIIKADKIQSLRQMRLRLSGE